MTRVWLLLVVLLLPGCITTTRLIGEPTDGESDGGRDADADTPDDGRDETPADHPGDVPETAPDGEDGALEDAAGDDAVPSCVVWAVPSGSDPLEDGSEAHPFTGLGRAVDGRGGCNVIRLRNGTAADPFEPRMDLVLASGESLTIEGDPAGPRAELDPAAGQGLTCGGDGTLVLRHLAVRNGHAANGGCLDADVGTLTLEDTEWSGCVAEWDPVSGGEGLGGAIRVVADVLALRASTFHDNTAVDGGGAWLDGPRGTAVAVIEDCLFQDNTAPWGGAVFAQITSLAARVARSRFVGNTADQCGSAVFWGYGTLGSFEGNRIEGNHVGDFAAVELRGAPETSVRHNIFVDNESDRCHPALAMVGAYGEVRNNLFVRNTAELGGGGCGGAVLLSGGNPDFRNNTFVDNSTDVGPGDLGGPADLGLGALFGSVRNNIFLRGSGTSAVAPEGAFDDTTIQPAYNDAWDGPEPAFDPRLDLGGEGNLFVDPQLVGGWLLADGSPCIDAGDPDPLLNDDDGTRNDIGAFGGPDGTWTPLGP